MAKHILVVDDDVGMLQLIEIVLRRQRYEVTKAMDGQQALQLLDEMTPDLCILDVMMPNMDGFELCRRLRSREDTRHTPILILSARGDSSSVRLGLDAGANAYVPKSTLVSGLTTELSRLLNSNGYSGALRSAHSAASP
ncbi:MAG: response regulator [Anaerolineae bacterium]|nr:response regulator [Anaerolineae bacterium]